MDGRRMISLAYDFLPVEKVDSTNVLPGENDSHSQERGGFFLKG